MDDPTLERTYACAVCLDRGYSVGECSRPECMQFTRGEPHPVVLACRSCNRGAQQAAGHWRPLLDTDRGLESFAQFVKRDGFFASKVRAIIDKGEPDPRRS